MAEPPTKPTTKPRFYASAQPQGTTYSPHLHYTPSHPTLHPFFAHNHTGTREGRPDIYRELNPEGNQPWMKTLTSSMPEPRQCMHGRMNTVDVADGSTDSLSTADSSIFDTWFVNQPTSDIYPRRPATGNAQVRPEGQEHGTQPLTSNPVFGRPGDGQIQENGSSSRNYRGNTRTADSRRNQIPADREQIDEPRLEYASLNAEVEAANANAQTFQQCILVRVREICTDVARRYWQTKRPRPHLVVDIPSSRATRRSAPYPERQRGDIPPTRHFHDPRRVLHWTRDEGEPGFVYTDSLEDLIWRISEQEWTQATERSRDWSSSGAHTERLTAVHRMNRLYDWTQTVLLAFEKVHDDHTLLSRTEMTDVMLAARDLAVWLLADDEKNEIQEMWAHVIQVER